MSKRFVATLARVAFVLALLSVIGQQSAEAQLLQGSVAAAGSAVELRSVLNGNRETYRGFLVGFEGRVTWNRLGLRAGYGQGPLDRTFVDFNDRQLVDAFTRLDVLVVEGLELGIAVRGRAYSAGSPSGPGLLRLAVGGGQQAGVKRWLLWEIHGRYERRVLPELLGVYADGWLTRPLRVNPGEVYHGGRGGEVGLSVEPGAPPVTVRFGYAIDEIRIGSLGRRETVERVTLSIGYAIGGVRGGSAAALSGSSRDEGAVRPGRTPLRP
ncbi:MAG: hypothetical protein ACREL7_09370 [Longimicrobiales bacterium]